MDFPFSSLITSSPTMPGELALELAVVPVTSAAVLALVPTKGGDGGITGAFSVGEMLAVGRGFWGRFHVPSNGFPDDGPSAIRLRPASLTVNLTRFEFFKMPAFRCRFWAPAGSMYLP